MFLKLFLNSMCSLAGYDLSVYLVHTHVPVGCTYQIDVYMNARTQGFFRTLLRSSQSFHQLIFFPQYIMVPSLPHVNSAHIPGYPYDVRETRLHWTRCPSLASVPKHPVMFSFWFVPPQVTVGRYSPLLTRYIPPTLPF